MVVLKDEQAVFKEEIQVALLSAIKVEVVYNQCEDFLCRQSKEVVFCFFEAWAPVEKVTFFSLFG